MRRPDLAWRVRNENECHTNEPAPPSQKPDSGVRSRLLLLQRVNTQRPLDLILTDHHRHQHKV